MPPCRGCQHSWADEARGCKLGSHQSRAMRSLGATTPQPPVKLVHLPGPRRTHKLAHVSSSLLLTHTAALGVPLTTLPQGLCRLKPPLATALTSWPQPKEKEKENPGCSSVSGCPTHKVGCTTSCGSVTGSTLRPPQPSLCEFALVGTSSKIIQEETGSSQHFPSRSRTNIFLQRESKTQPMSWNQPSLSPSNAQLPWPICAAQATTKSAMAKLAAAKHALKK